jgi:diaminopimelate decarboxylase
LNATSIAIVGFGPRGAGAFERLIAHQAPDSRPIEVTVFEPHPDLGAGPAYGLDQPEYLLMNFPASRIDASWSDEPERPPSGFDQGSFAEWQGLDPDVADRWYPPRPLVGRYLSEITHTLLESAPFPVELRPERVERIGRTGERWTLESSTGTQRFDEVLLAVGHARPSGPGPSTSQIKPDDYVGIRGFGLTAIDLILELTEGRGGRFVQDERGQLGYLPSGQEPSRIIPRSRSNRPMLVKPDSDRSPAPQESVAGAVSAGCLRILRLKPDLEIADLLNTLASLCGELLQHEPTQAAASDWLSAACEGKLRPGDDPAGAIRKSLEIDCGESPPNLAWALGLAWRELYPAIVERFSHGGLTAQDRMPFLRLAAELERLAFGPPPVNAAKLLALNEAGILDLTVGDNGTSRVDIELDAVIAPPGLHDGQAPLGGLEAAGFVKVPQGCRGVEVNRQARCVGADGTVTPGLAACGRLTEDWLMGNDTLNRSLHPETDRWAASLCNGKAAPAPVGALS